MYIVLAGCAQQGASSPLAISITEPAPVIMIGSASSTISSGAGEIDSTATASGGDGSYTYAWTLAENRDDANVFSINSAGTTNGVQYNDATINGVTPASALDPPNTAFYDVSCTVTDGNGDTATDTKTFSVEAMAA